MPMDKRQIKLNASVTGALFHEVDWQATPLGSPDGWDPYVAAAVQHCLNSRFPMSVVLGDEASQLVNVYNDGYLPIVSAKHPGAFGAFVYDVYAEIWEIFSGSKYACGAAWRDDRTT
ncbi:MAG: hypothetical protein U5O39_15225 [Gammaproteobacteria bacterium]|nr:hypothetical protein [Gammaproteobacteria bacterium]